MGPVLAQDVQKGIESFPEVETADVEVVFDPPWDQKMMSEAARLELGLF
jgi:metal-sulfur cluster biosynthetic enzyme